MVESEQTESTPNPADHVEYIRGLAEKSWMKGNEGNGNEGSGAMAQSKLFQVSRVVEEPLGEEKKAKRVFISSPVGGAYCAIGWVIQEDVENCMRCGIAFEGAAKENCVQCGDVVCTACNQNESAVEILSTETKFKVCSRCIQVSFCDH